MATVRPDILLVAGDPGGAAALVPVILQLQKEDRYVPRLLGYRQAPDIWRRAGLEAVRLPEDGLDAESILRGSGAVMLLTATSVNGIDHEKAFWRAARNLGIPSLALLDFWSNYRARFVDAAGAWCLPDRIAVMDARAAGHMVAAGLPASALVATGQPAFDVGPAKANAAARQRIRARLGIAAATRLVLFVSQPLADYYGKFHGNARALGFEEHGVARGLHAALVRHRRGRRPVVLCILPHPREASGAWSPAQGSSVPAVISPKGLAARSLAVAADLVVGMNSAFLLETCLMGLPTLSLQPGLKGEDALPTNDWKASVAVRKWSELPPVLERLLTAGPSGGAWRQRRRIPLKPGATARVVAELYGLLK